MAKSDTIVRLLIYFLATLPITTHLYNRAQFLLVL
jgi:hypothetical protein